MSSGPSKPFMINYEYLSNWESPEMGQDHFMLDSVSQPLHSEVHRQNTRGEEKEAECIKDFLSLFAV